MSLNSIILTGRIAKIEEPRQVGTNSKVCRFTIAVDRDRKEDPAMFIICEAWNNQADFLLKYLNKGNLIGIQGALNIDKYTKQDGSNAYSTKIRVVRIEALQSKTASEPQKTENNNVQEEMESYPELDLEDIQF